MPTEPFCVEAILSIRSVASAQNGDLCALLRLSGSGGGPAAVDGKRDAVYETGVVAGEEGDPGGGLLGRREAAGGGQRGDLPAHVAESLVRRGAGRAGGDRADPDPRGPGTAAQTLASSSREARLAPYMALFDPLWY
jgi:hypothetical protein